MLSLFLIGSICCYLLTDCASFSRPFILLSYWRQFTYLLPLQVKNRFSPCFNLIDPLFPEILYYLSILHVHGTCLLRVRFTRLPGILYRLFNQSSSDLFVHHVLLKLIYPAESLSHHCGNWLHVDQRGGLW